MKAEHLFDALVNPAHLEAAARQTLRGKRHRPDVAQFLFREEAEIERLSNALRDGSWRPDGVRLRRIRDPKRRIIAHATVADRVVHAAIVALLWPVYDRLIAPADYACRKGYGTDRALDYLQRAMRRSRYVVHLDIRAYFPSVDLDILGGLVRQRIADTRFLAVLDQVLASGAGLYDRDGNRAWIGLTPHCPPTGRGLPVGTHTSQFLATHVYLADLDQFVLRTLRAPGYLRYVDDVFIFADNAKQLQRWRAEVNAWVTERRSLLLKHPEAPVLPCRGTLDALGHRVSRAELRPLPVAWRRFRGRISARSGSTAVDAGSRFMASSLGLLLTGVG